MKRYHKLDEIRGITLISMMVYHGCWDAVYILGCDWDWYGSQAAYWWQQSIAWTFILLSGFCWQLGKRRLRRGLTVFGAGILVTLVTVIVMPQSRIVFGVLTLIGSCMLLAIPVDRAVKIVGRQSSLESEGSLSMVTYAGLIVSAMLFFLTRNVNKGFLGFEGLNIVQLPEALYSNGLTTYLGFPQPGFFSTDYFSLIPWFFLFMCGYFLFSIMERTGQRHSPKDNSNAAAQPASLHEKIMAPIRWMGRHSLLIYLLHQPALYAVTMIIP